VTPYLKTERATLYHARAEEVYPHLAPGSVSMVWSDGPYAMKKAPWDMMGIDGLADWYAPHVDAWGRICAPSATVYLWGTAEGWARLDPVMRASSWTFDTLIIWHKIGAHPARLGAANSHSWPDVTEVSGVYKRGNPPHINPTSASNVWDFDMTNSMRGERLLSGEEVLRTGGGTSKYLCRAPLHPCQKPLAFADRAIRASTRIGDTILDPFAGTNRIAVACRRLPEEERRHAIGIEMDRRWLDAVRPSLIADHAHTGHSRQPSLFTRPT
jgi:DNA modification methylase